MLWIAYLFGRGDFTQLGKFSRSLGGASRSAGILGTGAGVVGLGFELKSVQKGDMAASRFGYHLSGFVTSVAVGEIYGGLPGAAAGGLFWAGETIYDIIVVPGINMVWQLEMELRSMPERMLIW